MNNLLSVIWGRYVNTFLICLGLSTSVLVAQTPHEEPCLSAHIDRELRTQFPEFGSKAEFETWLSRKMVHSVPTRAVYTIPVIVHILHDDEAKGAGTNLSAARVQSQIDVLNEDFRRKLGTPGHNTNSVGADVEIEFCLATVGPDGQTLPEPGIHRISRVQMGFNAPPYSNNYLRNSVLPVTQWDPERYMNIWTAPLQNDIIGFAQLPSQSTLADLPGNYGPASTDGVVINVETFGRESGMQPPYNGGRTTTHEVGHFLGLWHIWGDGNCSVDDYCGDTPTAAAPNYGCPSSATSCSQASMVSNYMDYVDDACMNMFTVCQKQRMRTVLENAPRRASLLTSSACAGQLAPLADFRANQEAACEGQVVKFFDESLYGPTSWSWSFPGGDPASSTDANPQIRYSQPGSYDVSLVVSNAQGNQSLTRQGFININSVGNNNELFMEDFEGGLGDWTVENPDGGITWEIEATSGNGGSFAPGIELYFYDKVGQRDALISPLIDLSGFQNLALNIQYAYRPFSNSSFDSLIVYASTDGGNSFPHRLFAGAQGSGAAFNTGPSTSTSFTPASQDDWCGGNQDPCLQLDLNAFTGESQVKIKIESVNDYGNNLYVDNVSITGACSVTHIDLNEDQSPTWRIYPNPSTGWVTLEPLDSKQGKLYIQVLDAMGRKVWWSKRPNSRLPHELDLSDLPMGYYYLEVLQEDLRFGQKLQLIH